MKPRKLLVSLFVALVLGGSAVIAFATWTTTGSGSGTAKATAAQATTLVGDTPAGCLFPGATGTDACVIQFKITNPNPYDVTYTKLTAASITSSNEAACPASNVSVITTQQTGLSFSATKSTQSGPFTSPKLVSMDAAAPDGCQSIPFTVALTLAQ